jgi:hypothetical protein
MNTGNIFFRNIHFLENNHTELFRISRDGIWAHPDVPVDETAHKVIEALDSYIKELVKKAVEAEREACAQLCESRFMGDLNREDMEARRCAAAIRARGEA